MDSPSKQPDNCAPLSSAVELGEVTLVAHSRGQYPGTKFPPGILPGLRTIGYWDAVGPQTWGLPMHRNEGIEICCVLSGETSFATDNNKWTLQAGDITITRPWQRHQLGDPCIRPCKLFWMILDVEDSHERAGWQFPDWICPDQRSRRELLRIFRKNQCCYLADKDNELKKALQQSCEKLNTDDPLVHAILANIVNTTLLTVAARLAEGVEDGQQDPQGFDQTIRQFFHGLEMSIDKSAEPWNVEKMAHACRVGKSYLTSACRRIFNATPAEQLGRIRLNHARDLLLAHLELSITDIAFTCGFNSSQYFASCFRKQFGSTPQQYRSKSSRD
ncbi:AraC family transcriptional regulator [Roseibacillus persicicus]|uniref:AraC family transcriptional regulator n=1 Tax=Roseibacillus persicicus TaxID=454148 RepID=UPI00280D7CDC|nr:AraC family transcriptional regulator [Roseibacillus persicicus]MDQ8189792.1 AraC family transcriptional regulator [Roseibacillus persicicus]